MEPLKREASIDFAYLHQFPLARPEESIKHGVFEELIWIKMPKAGHNNRDRVQMLQEGILIVGL
jgi:hypothetical protein